MAQTLHKLFTQSRLEMWTIVFCEVVLSFFSRAVPVSSQGPLLVVDVTPAFLLLPVFLLYCGSCRSGELLGKGGFGTVRVVTHKETQNKYALKVGQESVVFARAAVCIGPRDTLQLHIVGSGF